jgi:hypothetical protein
MKKRIFIGSSSEELSTAKIVKSVLEKDFEVVIWDEKLWEKSVFKLNNNFLHDLLKAPLKFDYGILLGTPDDKVNVRGNDFLQARDNILFELGLFVGRLGIDKCAFLVDESVKDISDLGGIYLSKFNSKNLIEKVEGIKQQFINSSVDKFNFFPSNTLAYGYFENFVKSICYQFINEGKFNVDGKDYKKCKFEIIIPMNLSEDINLQNQKIKNKIGVKQIQIDYFGRPRPFFVNSKSLDSDELLILDFPTTLTGINYSIKELLPEEYKKFGIEYETILNRELERFEFTLKSLIKKNDFENFISIVRE